MPFIGDKKNVILVKTHEEHKTRNLLTKTKVLKDIRVES